MMTSHITVSAPRQPSMEMQQKSLRLPHTSIFSLKGIQDRPVSVATEFMESDFDDTYEDDEIISDYEDDGNSPRVSLNSGQPSFTTVSSYDEVQTPRSSRMPTDYYHPPIDHKQVEGPRGPHLFRVSTLSAEFQNALSLSPITPVAPPSEAMLGSYRMAHQKVALPLGVTPLPTRKPMVGPFQFTDAELDTRELATWSPEKVAQRMLDAGIELQVCERFVENDITGAILITLKFEDLKELGIPSFGVRTTVWNQINAMKNVRPVGEVRPETPIEDEPDREVRRELRWQDSCGGSSARPLRRRASSRRKKAGWKDDAVTPLESVSIVGIEQLVPKPHQCSKGENCSRWRRNQRMIEAFKRDHPFVDMDKGGIIMIAGDPGNPETAKALLHSHAAAEAKEEEAAQVAEPDVNRPVSDLPSVVASSDVMGPSGPPPAVQLQEDTLRAVQTRDPQDNVRQFLDFQHQHGVGTSELPPTPPFELFPVRQQPIGGLRALPRLSIPAQSRRPSTGQPRSAHPLSAQPLSAQTLSARTVSAAPASGSSYTNTAMEESPERTPVALYRFGSPFSEVDVPVTAVPVGPVSRDVSQSAPPYTNYPVAAPMAPPTRTMSRSSRRPSFPVLPALDENRAVVAPRGHQRSPSAATLTATTAVVGTTGARALQPPPRVKYPWSPERKSFETAIAPISSVLAMATPAAVTAASMAAAASTSSSSLASSTTAASAATTATTAVGSASGVTYQGQVKKRKTKMLRHEWHDRYVTLRGTRLAMHKDASTVDRTLEYVDIDDYAIACSSMAASTSKLNAAFKAMSIRRGSHSDPMHGGRAGDVAAFSFQLIPQDARGGVKLRKRESAMQGGASTSPTSMAANAAAAAAAPAGNSSMMSAAPPPPPDASNGTGKTHHFAVKSRDERIEWMRELMLARAMRQKGEGFEVSVNGSMI